MASGESIGRARERKAFFVLCAALTGFWAFIFAISIKGLAFAEPGGFPAFYGAARLARANLPELYNIALQNVFHPDNHGTGYFFHLPYEALLLIPLSYLAQVPAFLVWSALNLGCLYWSARILKRHFPHFGVLVPFAFAPTMCMLANGQDTAIITLIVAIGLDQFARGRDISSGAVLALGLFKFPLIVPLVAVLCFRHRRLLAGFAGASIPILFACWAMVGTQGIREYISMTRVTDAKENPLILCCLRGLVGAISGGSYPAVCIGLSVSLLVVAALVRVSRVSFYCIGILVTMLVCWHCHLYDAVFLIVPMAWLLESEVKWARWSVILLLIATPALLFLPFEVYLLAAAVLLGLGLLFTPKVRRQVLAA
jgi:hypothetical protein